MIENFDFLSTQSQARNTQVDSSCLIIIQKRFWHENQYLLEYPEGLGFLFLYKSIGAKSYQRNSTVPGYYKLICCSFVDSFVYFYIVH